MMPQFGLYCIANEERGHFNFRTELKMLPEVFESEEKAQKRADALGSQYGICMLAE
jgi:hypothetical protein